MKLKKFILSLVGVGVTFIIKLFIINSIAITGNNLADKIIFSVISVIIIVLVIKNMIDTLIIKKNVEKISTFHQLAMFVIFIIVAMLIWYLMNYDLFLIIISCFIVCYIVVFILNYKNYQVFSLIKRKIKKLINYNYNIKLGKIKKVDKFDNIFQIDIYDDCYLIFLENKEYDIEKIITIFNTKNIDIINNEENECVSNMNNYSFLIVKNVSIYKIIDILNQCQD